MVSIESALHGICFISLDVLFYCCAVSATQKVKCLALLSCCLERKCRLIIEFTIKLYLQSTAENVASRAKFQVISKNMKTSTQLLVAITSTHSILFFDVSSQINGVKKFENCRLFSIFSISNEILL